MPQLQLSTVLPYSRSTNKNPKDWSLPLHCYHGTFQWMQQIFDKSQYHYTCTRLDGDKELSLLRGRMAIVADPVLRKIWSFNRSECTCVIQHLLPVQSLSWVKKWLFISRILTIMLTSVLSSIAVCRACACFLTAEMTSFWISEASWSPVLHTFINSWSLDSKAKKEGKMKYSVNESKKIFFWTY